MIEYARALYPQSACSGIEQIETMSSLGSNRSGFAHQDGSCRVKIRADLNAEQTCATLVHEFGHLAGLAHTASGPMAPTLGPSPPCYKRFGSPWERAIAYMGTAASCSWARSTPRGGAVFACRETGAAGFRLRLVVTRAGQVIPGVARSGR